LFLQTHAAVTSCGAVDLDDAFVLFVRKLNACNGGRASGDFYYIAGSSADALHIDRREARNGAAHIFNSRFRNAQCERGYEGGWNNFRHWATWN
jgi:hypothetical protein